MYSRAVLLRGINVGGHNKITMADLVRALEEVGASNIRTYIQSGNVVLQHATKDPSALAELIRTGVRTATGIEAGVLVLTPEELTTCIARNPFPHAAEEPKSLHTFFLAAPSQINAVTPLLSDDESCQLHDKCLYLHAPKGIGKSKFARGAEKALGVEVTARNWRTVLRLETMLQEMSES